MLTSIFIQCTFAIPQSLSSGSGISAVSEDLASTLKKKPYGDRLAANKAQALKDLKGLGASSQEIAVIFGVAMTETNHFSAVEALEQQASNVKTGESINYGFLNLNKDAITSVDPGVQLDSLNVDTPTAMQSSLKIAHQLISAHGINGFLNFNRGGRTGLDSTGKTPDCGIHDCQGYRNNVDARANLILGDSTLLSSEIRLESHVAPK